MREQELEPEEMRNEPYPGLQAINNNASLSAVAAKNTLIAPTNLEFKQEEEFESNGNASGTQTTATTKFTHARNIPMPENSSQPSSILKLIKTEGADDMAEENGHRKQTKSISSIGSYELTDNDKEGGINAKKRMLLDRIETIKREMPNSVFTAVSNNSLVAAYAPLAAKLPNIPEQLQMYKSPPFALVAEKRNRETEHTQERGSNEPQANSGFAESSIKLETESSINRLPKLINNNNGEKIEEYFYFADKNEGNGSSFHSQNGKSAVNRKKKFESYDMDRDRQLMDKMDGEPTPREVTNATGESESQSVTPLLPHHRRVANKIKTPEARSHKTATSQLIGTVSESIGTHLPIHREKTNEDQELYFNKRMRLMELKNEEINQLEIEFNNNNASVPRFTSAFKTKAGCNVHKVEKINEDSIIVEPEILKDNGIYFYSVCDGHGTNGHLVSQLMKRRIPQHLLRFTLSANSPNVLQMHNPLSPKHNPSSNNNNNSSNAHEVTSEEIKVAINRSLFATNHEIFESDFDCSLSGSTSVSVLIKDRKLLCANVGDSRAVLAKRVSATDWKAMPLSRDHKPTLETEKLRILKHGGRIDTQKDFEGKNIGPLRVWLADMDMPGLAMTRSFGDKIGVQAGVIADPEILELELTDEDKFIIIASDGVWEYISNIEAVKLVVPFFERGLVDMAAEKILQESFYEWRKESLARDDITVIVVFINHNG